MGLVGDQRHLEVLQAKEGHPEEEEEEDRRVLELVAEDRPVQGEEAAIQDLAEQVVSLEALDLMAAEEVVACQRPEAVVEVLALQSLPDQMEEVAGPLATQAEALADLAVEEEQLPKEEVEAASWIQEEPVEVALERRPMVVMGERVAHLLSQEPKAAQEEESTSYQVVVEQAARKLGLAELR